MADDFANRINSRKVGVRIGDRPTALDIDDLRRRQQEHAKMMRPAPKEPFEELLKRQQQRGNGGGDRNDNPQQGGNSEPESDSDNAPKGPPKSGRNRLIRA